MTFVLFYLRMWTISPFVYFFFPNVFQTFQYSSKRSSAYFIVFIPKDFTFFSKKAMAPYSSTLAWKIPWTKESGVAVPGVAASRTRLSSFAFTFHFHHWRRKWQPTPVFLPGESQGRGSLVGCPLWGRTESDTTKVT